MPIWGMLPYISYPVWIVFWTIESTRGISQAINRRTGHDSECSIDIWVFGSGGTEPRTEACLGNWWGYGEGGVAGYLPSIGDFCYYSFILTFGLIFLHQHSDPSGYF